MNDLRLAFRQWSQRPGFALVAVAVLALGIGANSAIFSLINSFLLRPVLAHRPERLVAVYSHDTTEPGSYRSFSHPNFVDLQARSEVFESVMALIPEEVGLTEGDLTRRTLAMKVSSTFFEAFGLRLADGRAFQPGEDTSGAPVVVVSHRWWRSRGAEPGLVGRSITINGRSVTVVGIAPEGFTGPTAVFVPELFLPLSFGMDNAAARFADRGYTSLMVYGRLRDGLDLAAANARLEVISEQLARAYPDANRNQRLTVGRLPRMAIATNPQDDMAMLGGLSLMLLGMSGSVLLIAGLNLANMFLARGTARRKEIAIRLALGARRIRIIRQLLLEGLLLALAGGAAGLLLAAWTVESIRLSLTRISPVELALSSRPDWRVLLATLGFALAATLIFALGPALKLSRLDVNSDLKEHAGEDAGAARAGILAPRHLLVIAQVALSLALLVAAGLFARGALQAVRANPGFNFDQAFYLKLDGDLVGLPRPRARQAYQEILERLRQSPGVASASLAVTVPFGDMTLGEGVQQAGAPRPAPPGKVSPDQGGAVPSTYNVVTSQYFQSLGAPLRAGREFDDRESHSTNAPRVAIINTILAERLWPGQNPLGRRLQFARSGGPGGTGAGSFLAAGDSSLDSLEVVGVAPPIRNQLFDREVDPMVFVPLGQDFRGGVLLHIRAAPLATLDEAIRLARDTVRQVETRLPVLAVRTLSRHISDSSPVRVLHIGALLFVTLGILATVLAVIGVYAVKACAVARRTREIGIRLALGADRDDVIRLVLREGLQLTAVGLGIGLVLATGAAFAMSRFLYQVKPLDPVVFALAPAVLVPVAWLASWLPARRAARVDPVVALRTE